MFTGKIALKTTEQFMQDYVGTYQPLMPMFLDKAQAYELKVGQATFKRLEAMGDIRGKHVTPKDTVLEQILTKETSRVFKKYAILNQYRVSNLQDPEGINDVVKQVLDEYWKHQDELFLYGEGTSGSDVFNNGLYFSADSNFVLEGSDAIASTGGHLPGLHENIVTNAEVANKLAGKKTLVAYGTTVSKLNAVYAESAVPFRRVLQEVLQGYDIVKMPTEVSPSGAHGYLIVNHDQIKVHHMPLPELLAQGANEESLYTWHNFAMGSCMVEVLAQGAIIRQPLTFS